MYLQIKKFHSHISCTINGKSVGTYYSISTNNHPIHPSTDIKGSRVTRGCVLENSLADGATRLCLLHIYETVIASGIKSADISRIC